jgi:predicted cobalt transporter CbtA
MVGKLLMRGLLVGLLAGVFGFGFAKLVGEPQVDRAIAFEAAMDAARGAKPEPVLVSRKVQSSWGLLTGIVVYSMALGGIFALVFAFTLGRVGALSPRELASLIALGAFLSLVLIPALKYPANPPSVGSPETIGERTALYFDMIVISIAATVSAVVLGRRLMRSIGTWNAAIIAAALLLVVLLVATMLLPEVNEVPLDFPAVVLWRFRMAELGLQAVIWAVIGLGFGWLTERYT